MIVMDKLFNKIKATNIIKVVIRVLFGFLFIIIGLILAYIYKNNLFLVIGIVLCMLISVMILASSFGKDKKLENLNNDSIQNTMPYMMALSNDKAVTELYKVFNYKDYGNVIEVRNSMQGNLYGVKIDSVSIIYRLNNSFKNKYIRLYKLSILEDASLNLRSIKSEIFNNYRYEIIGDNLYISTINIKSLGRKSTFNPIYFKSYEDYLNRYKEEDKLIKELVSQCGGKENEDYDN